VSDQDPGDRVRRLSAAMRFLSQMHGIGSETDLIQAVIQAAAVWHDLDARAYRRGRDVLEMWLPGAELENDPRELTAGALVKPDEVTRISSMADFEQLGWHNAQREVVLLPIAPQGRIRWLLVVPGALDRETEVMLLLVCRTAASVLDKLASEDARALSARLADALAKANGEVAPVADALLGEFMTATGAVRGTLAIRRQTADKPVVLAARGDVGRGEPRSDVAAGQPVLLPERLAIALGLGGGADALVDLGAGPTMPFGIAAASLAEAGVSVIRAWLAGLSLAERRAPVSQRTEVSPAAPFEPSLGEEVGRARRLRLKGGVLVLGIEAAEAAANLQARSVLLEALRSAIRSTDLLGRCEAAQAARRSSRARTQAAENRAGQRALSARRGRDAGNAAQPRAERGNEDGRLEVLQLTSGHCQWPFRR
jgi:hypothetical protein